MPVIELADEILRQEAISAPLKFTLEIKRLYVDEKISAAKIAEKLEVVQVTPMTKLKAMRINIRYNINRCKYGVVQVSVVRPCDGENL